MPFVSTHSPSPYQPVPFASARVHLFYDLTIYLPFLFHDFPYTVKAGNSLTSGSALPLHDFRAPVATEYTHVLTNSYSSWT